MKIEWLGMSCFKIETKKDSGEFIIVIEPFENGKNGKKFPRSLSADILIRTPENNVSLNGNPFIIEGEGEYELAQIFVYGIGEYEGAAKKLVYRMEIEGISVVHLDGIQKELSDEIIENLQNVDILLIPIGGGDVLDVKTALSIISQIEPRVVIPMHYENLEERIHFMKALGANGESVNKFKVSAKDLPEDKMEIIALDAI